MAPAGGREGAPKLDTSVRLVGAVERVTGKPVWAAARAGQTGLTSRWPTTADLPTLVRGDASAVRPRFVKAGDSCIRCKRGIPVHRQDGP
jgi:hypothetical protein